METSSGNCYQEAWELMYKLGINPVLVHGYPKLTDTSSCGNYPKDTRYGHAWVEIANGEFCIDPSTGMLVNKEIYYKVGRIEEDQCRKYTKREAAEMLTKQVHYGPWEDVPEDAQFHDSEEKGVT